MAAMTFQRFLLSYTWAVIGMELVISFPDQTTLPIVIDGEDISDEKRLVHDLLAKYDMLGRDGRPVKNASHAVTVEFGLGLIKMELHEKENMLSLSTWARYRWKDEYLQWNPDEYGGVSTVKLSHGTIWIPDIMLYNTANTEESERKVMQVVSYEGIVTWYPHKVFQSSCAIDVRNFPFDNQTCHMWFGSWTYTVNEVNVKLAFPGGIDLSTFKSVYKEASEWDIYNSTAERIEEPPNATDNTQYAILSFSLRLRRKLMFSTYILTMPAIFLSFLTLLVFWLPPEHADKSALGLTIFGSLLLLLLILVEAAPPTASAVPLLGVYYCFTTVIVILSIFLSSLVVKIGRSDDSRKKMPRWLRLLILNGLGSLLCLHFAKKACSCCEQKKTRKEFVHMSEDQCEREPFGIDKTKDPERARSDSLEDLKLNGTISTLVRMDKRLHHLHDLIHQVIAKRLEKEEQARIDQDIATEWRRMALVLDRLFFISYLVTIVISLAMLFPRNEAEIPMD